MNARPFSSRYLSSSVTLSWRIEKSFLWRARRAPFTVLFGTIRARNGILGEKGLAEQLDAVDAKILDLIQHDASLSVAEIAERVGLSSSPCWRRIKRMKGAGVIRQTAALIEREAVGLGFMSYAFVKLALPSAESRHEPAVAAAAVPGAAYLAAGTNLIDLMKGGVMRPERLVDVTHLPGLDRIDWQPDGAVRIGALVRNADLAHDDAFARAFPAVAEALLSGASAQLRNASATAGLTHTLSSSLSVHARTSVAGKPEGYSAFTGNPALVHFESERQWANEVGLTFGAPKSRFGGSLLAFYTTIKDYQFERTVPGSTDFVVVNAAEVLSRGFEAKVIYSPVDRVWLDLQAGYTSATFEDHRDATGASVNGKHVPYVPRSTLRAGVTVDLTRGFSANASYAAAGRTVYDERNTATFVQKSYGIVNAQLRYRQGQWTGAVYAQNLFQKDYYQFINPEIFAGAPGAPRRVGVQLTLEF
eukprot:gene34126-45752_t